MTRRALTNFWAVSAAAVICVVWMLHAVFDVVIGGYLVYNAGTGGRHETEPVTVLLGDSSTRSPTGNDAS